MRLFTAGERIAKGDPHHHVKKNKHHHCLEHVGIHKVLSLVGKTTAIFQYWFCASFRPSLCVPIKKLKNSKKLKMDF
jgi:hypothetical protein